MANDKVTVSLRRTYGYQGIDYGPGIAVEVPRGLADALGLKPVTPTEKKAVAKAAAPTESSADALAIENGSAGTPVGSTDGSEASGTDSTSAAGSGSTEGTGTDAPKTAAKKASGRKSAAKSGAKKGGKGKGSK